MSKSNTTKLGIPKSSIPASSSLPSGGTTPGGQAWTFDKYSKGGVLFDLHFTIGDLRMEYSFDENGESDFRKYSVFQKNGDPKTSRFTEEDIVTFGYSRGRDHQNNVTGTSNRAEIASLIAAAAAKESMQPAEFIEESCQAILWDF